MKCLQWFVEERLPTPKELEMLAKVIQVNMFLMSKMGCVPVKAAFVLMLRLSFMMELFELGIELVKRALEEEIKKDPMLGIFAIMLAA
ncbi:MAG: hypothetical protein NC218_01975 [Acetobacter sp.]|nr:hypothetical protein [Acetobacter sp.]